MPSSRVILSEQVRRQFLDYFKSKGHTEVPSSSLVPANDPTLLFSNAGMNQFKDVFTGQTKLGFVRATSSQKCVRAGGKHNDLDNVGRTARHHTFFEMLGNFSFGDYFKPDAIAFAYELLTSVYGIDKSRLIYTVHHSDDEAATLWRKIAGVGDDRVIRLGDKDNFWAMGETGPCGPCSEIHYQQWIENPSEIPCAVEAAGGTCERAACDCDRWIEIWNLVFMQFEQVTKSERRPLPRPSVDTGMGLERLCAVLQGVRSNYETDLLRPMLDRAVALSGKTFVPDDYQGESVSLRAIADHARAAAFLIADGVFPEKNGREYVLRRIMRRAVYHGWLIGIDKPFLATVADDVIAKMGGVYPDVKERASLIGKTILEEETRFRETLDRGVGILDDKMRGAGGKVVAGAVAFQLYDTYGFPIDLTRVIAEQRGWTVDEAGFETAMAEQRKRSEFQGSGEVAVDDVFKKVAERVGATPFRGYEGTRGASRVVALVADGKEVDTVGPYSKRVAVITAETPFYGEQGGQIGDAGVIRSGKARLRVDDVKRPVSTLYVHLGEVTEGELRVGDTVELVVDAERRDAIRRNHSATHLLHWALRTVLGAHVTQKGSLVAPDRLRFDFSHFAPLTPDERRRVEDLVNARVRANLPAETDVLAISEAKKAGAIAFFGEKYGDTVRVLTMGESKEFCGGTHVSRTGDIAFFTITEETGVAQGVRRIEAVTGEGAAAYVRKLEHELGAAGEMLRAGLFEVSARVAKLQAEAREREKEIDRLKRKLASGGGRDLVAEAREIGGVRVLATRADVADPKALREVADQLRDKIRSGVVVLAGVEGDKIALVSMVTPDLTDRYNAGKIVGEVARHLGGKGGGRADMAQGGGIHPEKLDAALARVFELVGG